MPHFSRTQRTVIIGDVVVLILMTLLGFATHLSLDALGRIIVTTAGVIIAWAAVSPFVGVYDERRIADPGSLWRVAWAWVLAAPLAGFLRAAALNRDISWVFVLVTMGTSGLALMAWRVIYGWRAARS